MADIDPLMIAGVLLTLGVLAGLFFFWSKDRPVAGANVFRASRLSAGNRLFPTQVAITPTSVVHYKPQWIGKREHSTHITHVASVRIDTNLFFSNVFIETTGGANPIRCHGHLKSDAVRMKALIERYQSEYYRGGGPGDGAPHDDRLPQPPHDSPRHRAE